MKIDIGPYRRNSTRKVRVHIDSYDAWSMDHTLSYIILPLLVHLQEHKHGIPNEFAQVGGEDWSDQLCFDFYSDTHNEAFDLGCEKWDQVLDKMIWSFKQLVEDEYSEKYHHGDSGKLSFEKTTETMVNPLTGKSEEMYTSVREYPDRSFYDAEGAQLHEQRIQEGLDLFGKYFRSLWD